MRGANYKDGGLKGGERARAVGGGLSMRRTKGRAIGVCVGGAGIGWPVLR